MCAPPSKGGRFRSGGSRHASSCMEEACHAEIAVYIMVIIRHRRRDPYSSRYSYPTAAAAAVPGSSLVETDVGVAGIFVWLLSGIEFLRSGWTTNLGTSHSALDALMVYFPDGSGYGGVVEVSSERGSSSGITLLLVPPESLAEKVWT